MLACGQWLSIRLVGCSAKRIVFSRAYINFINPEDLYDFKAKFDGHLFVGSRGNQYRAAVEYAPFQKVPTAQPRKHNKQGTIEKGEFLQGMPMARKGCPV